MSRERKNLAALYLVTILVGAALCPVAVSAETTSGGQASVANTGDAPDVYIADAVVDDSSGNSQLEVAFDATGEIAANDVKVTIDGPSGFEPIDTKEPGETEGTVTMTVPEGEFGGGNLTLSARLWNASAGKPVSLNASDDALVEVESPIKLVDYSVPETVFAGEEFTATATLENTGNNDESFTLGLYDETHSSTHVIGFDNEVTVAAGNTETVSLTATASKQSGDYQFRVNDQSATTVSVENRVKISDVTVHDEVEVGEPMQVDVTLTNPTDAEGTRHLPYSFGSTSDTKSATVDANSEETVSLEQTFEEPGEKNLWIDGVRKTAYVLNDTEGTADLTVSNYYDQQSAVVGNEVYFTTEVTNHGDASGVREVTLDVDGETVASDTVYVEQNETEYAFLSTTFEETGSYTATIDGNHEVNVTVRDAVVRPESVSIEHVDGTAPDSMPTVDAGFSSRGWVWVDVTNEDGRYDLGALGADETTVFEITFTVEDYTPRVLVSSGQDLNWDVTDNADGTKTVSIRASPAQFEYMSDPPRLENWDDVENDRADFSMDAAMFIGIDDANRSEVYGEDTEDLTGMTVATDAQTFLPPQYYPGSDDEPPRLEIQLAGPHLTKAGNENEGHYEAFLPDRLLDAWDVTDPEQLTAAYSDTEDVAFTTTEVDGGVRVRLDLHYSSGTVSISKTESDDDSGGTVGNVGGGGGNAADADDETTTTTTETTTTDDSVTTSAERTTVPETTASDSSDDRTETTAVDATTTVDPTTTATSTTAEATTGETTSDGTTELDRTTPEPTENGGGTPGFGAGVAVAALASALVALRCRAAS